MRIASVETILVSIPYETGPTRGWPDWTHLNTVLVRIETDDGLVGWGDAFGYHAARATKAAVDHIIAPLLIGRDATDIARLSYELQQKTHLLGRYGITTFAISGVDIALWDLAGKAAGQPLARLLGGSTDRTFASYASFARYDEPEVVAERVSAAVNAGYRYVKLHEVTYETAKAAREAGGDDMALMVDTNCPWTEREALAMARRFKPLNLYWLEEPVFPPEDFAALARVQAAGGVPLAAGENACTSFEFAAMFRSGAVTYAQPSVTKVGGVSEFRKIIALAEHGPSTIVPHAPYFGPGFLATLHLMASLPHGSLVERLYVEPEAQYFGDAVNPVAGSFTVPDGPGLGIDPDPNVIKDYRVADA
ncbi:MAG: mandelate racemase/muconate lactonizing enzyme family protein [Alphaproteobacteria bacterium]